MNTSLPDPPAPLSWRRFALHTVSPAVLTFGLFLALIFGVILPAMERNFIERKKEMLRELTQAAMSEIRALQEQEVQGLLTRAQAQQAAVRHVGKLRYGDDGKDYYWLTDLEPRMVVHPYRPDLDGRNLADYADPAGRKLFVDAARIVREQGGGYIEYLWQWKDDEHRIVPKLSYVMGFEPWGWVLGTGVYLEDVRQEIARVTRHVAGVSVGISALVALLLGQIIRQALHSERRRGRAEAALRESEAKYRLLVEGSSDGLLLVLQGRPVYANRPMLDLIGCAESELGQRELDMILEPIAANHGKTGAGEQRARLLRQDGSSLDVMVGSAPVDFGGRVGQILSVRDAGARRKTEETLSRLVAELQSILPLATSPVGSVALSTTACPLETSIGQAAALMAREKAGALLVQGPDERPVGIVTNRDLRDRVLAAECNLALPVSSIMSAPLARVSRTALLFEAALEMQERGVGHLVVTGSQGEVVGVLSGTAILHAQRHALALLLSEIRTARTPAEVRDARAKLPVFVRVLLEGGTRVENVTRIMSAVADAVLARLLHLAEQELGPPPVPYAFLVLGSEARGEQTLATDQDNALLFADPAPEAAEAVRAYFLKLGETVCEWLDLAGYRRCKGGTMACNPKWCQPLAEWRRYFTECVEAASPQDLLDVNIFFDFRCAHGDTALAGQLRGHWQALLAAGNRRAFFFHLAQSTLQFRPPHGFFGTLQMEPDSGHPDAFNIKAAIIPLVNFARMYALQHGFAETNTLDRLRLLRDRHLLLPSSHDEMVQALTTLGQMRLNHQAAQIGRGEAPDNFIRPGELTQLEHAMLKKVFADITVFQARLQHDFARTA